MKNSLNSKIVTILKMILFQLKIKKKIILRHKILLKKSYKVNTNNINKTFMLIKKKQKHVNLKIFY